MCVCVCVCVCMCVCDNHKKFVEFIIISTYNTIKTNACSPMSNANVLDCGLEETKFELLSRLQMD